MSTLTKKKKPAKKAAKPAPVMKDGTGPIHFSDEIWIAAPLARVWQLVTKGAWLDRYFTSLTTGNLDEPGKVIMSWGKESERVEVMKAVWEKSTSFRWIAAGVPYATRVTIQFESHKKHVRVSLSEKGWKRDKAGIASALHHAIGWTNFLCSLKAFAQFGVELRS